VTGKEFVKGLLEEMGRLFARLGETDTLESESDGRVDVVTLLKLALKSELEASELAGFYMPTTPEVDAKMALALQCGDEMKHYGMISQRLAELGEDLASFDPLADGHSPLYQYLRGLRTTVERIAAGTFASEAIAEIRNAAQPASVGTLVLYLSLHAAGGPVGALQLVPGLAVFGTGMGMIFVPLFSIIMGEIGDDEVGSASGLLESCQQLGASLGVAVLATLFFSTISLEPGRRGALAAAAGSRGPLRSTVDTSTRIDRPTCNGWAARSCGSMSIRTGSRCTTLIQLPVAFCAGSSANDAPVPALKPTTVPRYFTEPPYRSAISVAGCPMRIFAICSSLKLASTQTFSSGITASSGVPASTRWRWGARRSSLARAATSSPAARRLRCNWRG